MSERVRDPAPSYTNEEVGKILKRAAGLQREQGVPGAKLTQSEIEQIAADAGIDPAQVRKAIAELNQPQPSSTAATIFGAPTRLSIERIVPGELDPKHHEAVALTMRRQLDGPGLLSTVGRTLTYLVAVRNSPVEISLTPSSGTTVVRISANYANIAGGIFGGIVGGFGGSAGANIAWMLPTFGQVATPLGIAAGLGVVGLTWMGCRVLYRALAGSHQKQLAKLADALEQQVQSLASS